MTRKKKKRLVILGVLVVVYIGSYAVLSARGSYVELICGTSDGSEHWYPLGCDNHTPSPSGRIKTKYPSPLGVFYLPLLLVDQRFIHPSKPGFWNTWKSEQKSEEAPVTSPPVGAAEADRQQTETER